MPGRRATTSPAGASLPTKPEAPASMAAKIWSSPECMVSTTRPSRAAACASRRTMSRPVPSGQLQVGDDDVGLELLEALRAPRPPSRPRRRPRCRARGRTTSAQALADQLVVVDEEHRARRHVGHRRPRLSCLARDHRRRRTGSRSSPATRTETCGPAARVGRRCSSVGADEPGPLVHDLQAVRVDAPALEAAAVVGDDDLGLGRVTRQCTSIGRGLGVPHGVVHRLLGDPQQLGLDLGAQPRGAARRAVTWIGTPDTALRWRASRADRGAEALAAVDAASAASAPSGGPRRRPR